MKNLLLYFSIFIFIGCGAQNDNYIDKSYKLLNSNYPASKEKFKTIFYSKNQFCSSKQFLENKLFTSLLKSYSLKYPQNKNPQFDFLYLKENWDIGKCKSTDEDFDRTKLSNRIELVDKKVRYSTYKYSYMIDYILYNEEYAIVAGKFYGMEIATLYKNDNGNFKSIVRVDNSQTGYE